MEIKERIDQYFAKHPSIETKYAPDFYYSWKAVGGNFFYDSITKKRHSMDELHNFIGEHPQIVELKGSDHTFIYYAYDPELKAMEICRPLLKVKRYKDDQDFEMTLPEWFNGRIVAFDGIPVFYDKNGNVVHKYVRGMRYDYHTYCTFLDGFINRYGMTGHLNLVKNKEEFEKFTGNWKAYTVTGKNIKFEDSKFINYWIENYNKGYGPKVVDPSKKKKKSDRDILMELASFTPDDRIEKEYGCATSFKFYKVNDDWGLIATYDYAGYLKSERAFVSKKKKFIFGDVEIDSDGTRIVNYCASAKTNCDSFRVLNLAELSAFLNSGNLVSTAFAHATASKANFITVLKDMASHSLYERIYTSEFKDLIFKNGFGWYLPVSVKFNRKFGGYKLLKSVFGEETNEKGRTIYDCIGVNKGQLKFIQDYMNTRFANADPSNWRIHYDKSKFYLTIQMTKKLFGSFDIRSIDVDTFGKVFEVLNEVAINSNYYYGRGIAPVDIILAGCETKEDKLKRINKYIKMKNHGGDLYEAVRLICDTYRIDPAVDTSIFETFDDIQRTHDRVLEEYNARNARCRTYGYDPTIVNEDFAKNKAKRDIYEEEDDNYMIINPKAGSDITNEGNSLHHCVGGYVRDHAACRTNILFLRKKSEPDTPWFTIELGADKSIRQIHGLHNRWLSFTNEGYAAVPFVMKWIAKHNIHCDDKILLNTSSSYCANSTNRAKPVI